jgi:rubrerythrin
MENSIVSTRRNIFGMAGKAVLSLAAVGVIAGEPALAARSRRRSSSATQGDVDILNVALGLEHEAIAAYQIGAESGLLPSAVLGVAVLFQGHHKGHRDALTNAITTMGGTPVASRTQTEYATALNAGSITSATDILRLAQRLERGAANAYLGVIPSFGSKDLAQVAAKLASDETAHWALLSQALNDSLPATPFVVS